MSEKIKINLNILKWGLTCFFLLGNLLLLAKNDDRLFIIIYEISINILAICSFSLLSFFPRLYYIFDDCGVSYQNRRGKEFIYIRWDEVIDISYTFVLGFIPDGLEIKWKTEGIVKNITLIISLKQSREIYNVIPKVKDIIDKK